MLELFPAIKDDIFPKVKPSHYSCDDIAHTSGKCLEIIKDNKNITGLFNLV